MSEQDWESIAKERLDAIVQFKARALAAEARVKVLEEFIRSITYINGPYPFVNGTEVVYDANIILAAKEKP